MEQTIITGITPSFISPWMSTDVAADYIGCKSGTLKTWRATGKGPRFHTVSNKLVRYHVNDLEAFMRGEDQELPRLANS